MKKYIAFLFSVAVSFSISAQSYIPFPTDSTVKWFYMTDSHSPSSPYCCYTYFTETILGDSVIAGDSYERMSIIEWATSQNSHLPGIYDTIGPFPNPSDFTYGIDNRLDAYMREDSNRRVTYFDSLLYGPFNAFDFSLLPNDTLTVGSYGSTILFHVDSIAPIQTTVDTRDVYYYGGQFGSQWIEGIGSNYKFQNQMIPFEGGTYLVGFSRNDTCILGDCPVMDYALSGISNSGLKNKISLFPNPASNEIHFTSDLTSLDKMQLYSADGKCVSIFNLQGQKTFSFDVSGLARGFYIYTITANNGSLTTGKITLN